MTFGNILRNLLDEHGLSQKQLATELNIAASTLGNYIQDTREPDFATLRQFADYFKVSIDYLLSHQHQPSTSSERERELLRVFQGLTLEQQHLYIEQGKVFVRLNVKKETASSISNPNRVG